MEVNKALQCVVAFVEPDIESMPLHMLRRRHEVFLNNAEAMQHGVLAQAYLREAAKMKRRIDVELDPTIVEYERLVEEWVDVERQYAKLLRSL